MGDLMIDEPPRGIAGRPPREDVLIWRPAGLPGVEALMARYTRQEFLPHRHDAILVGIIERGVHSVWCRGSRTAAGPGFVATFDRGEVHHGGAATARGWQQRILYVDDAAVTDVLDDRLDGASSAGALHFRDPFRPDGRAAAALREVHEALRRKETGILEQQTRFEELLWALVGRFAAFDGRGPLAPGAPAALERVREYLHANLRGPCHLGELARVAGLRRGHLVRSFRERFGLPPHRYLTQIRVDAARALLARGEPASDVAADVGFADQSHFVRHFKAIVGVTPGRYAPVSGPSGPHVRKMSTTRLAT